MKLTVRAIKALTYAGGWDVRWDDELPGFGVRLFPSGRKSFVVSYRAGGRKRLMSLGGFGVLTVDQARAMAREHLVTVSKGGDPLEEKRRAAQGETFGDLSEAYIERHAKPHKKSWEEDDRRLKQHIPAGWKGRRADKISGPDVARLHASIGARAPYEANRLLALLHKMFRLAPSWGFLPEGAPNPAAGITKFREKKRKRWVKEAEIPALAAATDQEPNVYIRAALWLYLLTGLRKAELLQARRTDIEWKERVLRLPDTKSDEEQFAPLSAHALAILQATPELNGNPYLLPSTIKKRGHLVNIDKSWRRVRQIATVILWAESEQTSVRRLVTDLRDALDRMPTCDECMTAAKKIDLELPTGLMDARLHDLRRTVGSWLSQEGVDLNLIREALRHAEISTTLVYARLGRDPAREAMEDHGRRLMKIAGRTQPVALADDDG
ncbi:MAG: site-specific integrase [Kiloniellales bacterium]|nr:site-specific integrase [Kiloniellales bacterium]